MPIPQTHPQPHPHTHPHTHKRTVAVAFAVTDTDTFCAAVADMHSPLCLALGPPVGGFFVRLIRFDANYNYASIRNQLPGV